MLVTSTAAPKPKELRIGLPGDTISLDGDRATLGQQSPNANIYERLIRMDDDFQIQPWLAEKWEFVAPNTWRFRLRKDVTFSDGSPMTAKDVVYTFDRAGRAGRNINAADGATKAIDDYTVEFTPTRPNRKVPLQLVHPTYGIMKAGSDPVKAPIGTGPFSYVSYAPKESFKVVRNDKYWDKAHAAKVSGITFLYLPDATARMFALKAGDVDAVVEVPRESVAQAKKDGFAIDLSPVGAYEAMYIAVRGPAGSPAITADPIVRKAIAMSIDRKTIVDSVWEGNADYGKNLIPPAILGAAASRVAGGPAYDLNAAKALLDGAGWKVGDGGVRSKDGVKLTLTLVSGFPSPDIHRPVPEVLQQQLRKAGIQVLIVETTDYSNNLKGIQGDLWLERGNQNDANPAFLPSLLFVSEEAGNKDSNYAKAFSIGDALDKPIAAAQATEDIAKTQQLTADAMKAMIDDQFVIVPIAGIYNIWANSKKITGFKPHSAFVHTDLSTVAFTG